MPLADLVSVASLLTHSTGSAVPGARLLLQPGLAPLPRVKTPTELRAMEIDFAEAAETWDTAAEVLQSAFTAVE